MFLQSIFPFSFFCSVLGWCGALRVRWTRTIWHGYLDPLLWDTGCLSQLHQPLWETPTLNQRFCTKKQAHFKSALSTGGCQSICFVSGHVPPAGPPWVLLEKCPHWSNPVLCLHYWRLQPGWWTRLVYAAALSFLFSCLVAEFSHRHHILIFYSIFQVVCLNRWRLRSWTVTINPPAGGLCEAGSRTWVMPWPPRKTRTSAPQRHQCCTSDLTGFIFILRSRVEPGKRFFTSPNWGLSVTHTHAHTHTPHPI